MSIKTFRQFDVEIRREVARKFNVPLSEVNSLYGPSHYLSDWQDYAVGRYEAGDAFTTVQWNKLPAYMQRQILRTSRALRMPGNLPEPWKRAA